MIFDTKKRFISLLNVDLSLKSRVARTIHTRIIPSVVHAIRALLVSRHFHHVSALADRVLVRHVFRDENRILIEITPHTPCTNKPAT